MPIKKQIEIEAIAKDAIQQIQALNEKVAGLEDSLKAAGEQTKKTNKLLGGLKNLVKGGLGLAVVQKAFELLRDTFSSNQKVVNLFNTGVEALSLSFNDLFNFLDRNVGTVIDYFKGLFDNPVQSIKNFGQAIVDNIIERVKSSLDALGFLGDAVVKVFEGDFAGAAESAKNAGKELFDVVTGVDNTFDKVAETMPTVVKGITDYAKSTFDAAQQTVELNRQAEIGIAQNRIILEQKDREAEKLRQIRDDETKTIAERIQANEDLAAVLDKQEELMLANADAVIAAAQAQFDKNANDENQIALLEAKAEREGILAQIEGFRSEQLMNRMSLDREAADLAKEKEEEELDRKEKLLELEKERKEAIKDNLDTIIDAAGQESEIGRAVFIAKQAMMVKEQIAEAKATLQRITLRAAEAQVDTAKGASATAKVGFPQNIPLLIAFAAQAAGIIASVKSAVQATKSASSGMGGGGGFSSPSIGQASQPTAPAFNVVGSSGINQIAETLGQEQPPVKAYVVSNEVTNAQSLDRNIVENASLG
jgi:hypothetical protein